MENNVFYVYIRLRNTPLTELPLSVRETLHSDYGENKILSLSVCKEREIEACLAEKVKFWKESMANVETNLGAAELVIHQIQTSNGGLELSHTIMGAIAEAKLALHITYTVCKLI